MRCFKVQRRMNIINCVFSQIFPAVKIWKYTDWLFLFPDIRRTRGKKASACSESEWFSYSFYFISFVESSVMFDNAAGHERGENCPHNRSYVMITNNSKPEWPAQAKTYLTWTQQRHSCGVARNFRVSFIYRVGDFLSRYFARTNFSCLGFIFAMPTECQVIRTLSFFWSTYMHSKYTRNKMQSCLQELTYNRLLCMKTRKSVSLSYDYIYWGLRYIEKISNNCQLLSNNIGLIALAISFHASITAVYLSWVNLEVDFFRGRFFGGSWAKPRIRTHN